MIKFSKAEQKKIKQLFKIFREVGWSEGGTESDRISERMAELVIEKYKDISEIMKCSEISNKDGYILRGGVKPKATTPKPKLFSN